MITQEPVIKVGIYEGYKTSAIVFEKPYRVNGKEMTGALHVKIRNGRMEAADGQGTLIAAGEEIDCMPASTDAIFQLKQVTIGVNFHWERKEDQTFTGGLRLVLRSNKTIAAINTVPLEEYLRSVISSEMSATAPLELLKAHAITSRSWLVAMVEKSKRIKNTVRQKGRETKEEIVRWYDREDHDIYDVCADDHCQRYQGLSKIISHAASKAIDDTRGVFLVHNNEVCDARYYKACGGRTEEFQNAWEDMRVPYLASVSDSSEKRPTITTEEEARKWIASSPDAYCNTTDGNILRQILPSFDQETTDFYRWRVEYAQKELSALVRERSGIDFGDIVDLIPLQRGPSGRLFKLKIVGSKRTVIVGKELEIRKWLSKSHLYSSAFVVDKETEKDNSHPTRFTLRGAGWGHGVGFCQIGAAVMAVKGFSSENIVSHYFPGAALKKLYE